MCLSLWEYLSTVCIGAIGSNTDGARELLHDVRCAASVFECQGGHNAEPNYVGIAASRLGDAAEPSVLKP